MGQGDDPQVEEFSSLYCVITLKVCKILAVFLFWAVVPESCLLWGIFC